MCESLCGCSIKKKMLQILQQLFPDVECQQFSLLHRSNSDKSGVVVVYKM